jgi:hypothetical protein
MEQGTENSDETIFSVRVKAMQCNHPNGLVGDIDHSSGGFALLN